MTGTGGHNSPSPLVETNWLSERLDIPDVQILDCSVIMNVTDDGDHHYSSGKTGNADPALPMEAG